MKILFFREGGKMLTKRKKIFILFGMVALLVVTGCLNLFLSNSAEEVPTSTYESTSFLTSYRASKYETRQTMKEYYNSIIEWHEKRYGTTGLTRECIEYENGVMKPYKRFLEHYNRRKR